MSPHTTLTLRGSRARRSRLRSAAVPNLRLTHLVAFLAGLVLCTFLQLRAHPKVALETNGSTQPTLFDLTGSLRFGPGYDALGGMLVYDASGTVVGRYVDDKTPNQQTVINEEMERWRHLDNRRNRAGHSPPAVCPRGQCAGVVPVQLGLPSR